MKGTKAARVALVVLATVTLAGLGACGMEEEAPAVRFGEPAAAAGLDEATPEATPELTPVAAAMLASLAQENVAAEEPARLAASGVREQLSVSLRAVLDVRDIAVGELGELALPRPGRMAGTAATKDGVPGDEDEYCWEESYPDGSLSWGCWNLETGAFLVVYEMAEPYEGIVRIEQEGVAGYTGFDAGYSDFVETYIYEDGAEYTTEWLCGFEGNTTACEALTQFGDRGWVTYLEETEYLYEEQIWTDDATYAVAWGTTYVADGSAEMWYWLDDLETEFETDYFSRQFYDPDGSGWGMFEIPAEDGEMDRYTMMWDAEGEGFYTDEEGNSYPFEDAPAE